MDFKKTLQNNNSIDSGVSEYTYSMLAMEMKTDKECFHRSLDVHVYLRYSIVWEVYTHKKEIFKKSYANWA